MKIGGTEVTIVQSDITTQQVDAIVNAANADLRGGGGVDGAIHRAGGPSIMEETRQRYSRGCPTGAAVITGAGNLPARWVIHAVGPVWGGGDHNESRLLASAYESCLSLASDYGATTIAFPSISTGAYSYPVEQAALVAVGAVANYLSANPLTSLKEVRFVLFDEGTMREYMRAAKGK